MLPQPGVQSQRVVFRQRTQQLTTVTSISSSASPCSHRVVRVSYTVPGIVVRCIISYRIVSYRTISYHIISYQIRSYHITSHHITPYNITSYHITPYHIISYHIISYHTISYHIIPYHTISSQYRIIPKRTYGYPPVLLSIQTPPPGNIIPVRTLISTIKRFLYFRPE